MVRPEEEIVKTKTKWVTLRFQVKVPEDADDEIADAMIDVWDHGLRGYPRPPSHALDDGTSKDVRELFLDSCTPEVES